MMQAKPIFRFSAGALLCLLAACTDQTNTESTPASVRFELPVRPSDAGPGVHASASLLSLDDRVRVEIHRIENSTEQRHDFRARTDWAQVKDMPEWQLRQYRARRDDGAWGYISYDALRATDVTPMGNRIEFVCQGAPRGEPIQCWGGYRSDAHTQVWYFFHHKWMAQWAQIHMQVVKTVEQRQERD
jgi:hypothetical protein